MSAVGLASSQDLPSDAAHPVRVMLVDDSTVSRALMARWIEESGDALVVAAFGNGRNAIAALRGTPVDVIVLDIEMPELDGLAALPQLLDTQPGVQVLMASSLTQRGANATLEALRLGAADAIGKPRAGWVQGGSSAFADELVAKVMALGSAAHRKRQPASAAEMPEAPAAPAPPDPGAAAHDLVPPKAIVIGASTGGPNALFRLVEQLPADLPVPVFITQHMPPTFTAILADHLTRHTGKPAREAEHGMLAQPGHVYIAPGGRHMSIAGTPDRPVIVLGDEPPENFCRPSVNPLMRSAARLYGPAVLGAMLTGMGADGLEGARDLVRSGGILIAQDQTTSVVWGMPGAVVREGLAAEILPLDEIAGAIARRLETVP